MASKELFLELERSYESIFKESLSRTFMKMLKKTFPIEVANRIERSYNSLGMTGVISVAGKYTGRIIFDTSEIIARKFASTMLHKEVLEEAMV
jgi:CheY-specific phosphatase CheX